MEKPGCTVEKIGNILFVYDPAIPDDQSGNIYRQITVPLKFLGKRESEKYKGQKNNLVEGLVEDSKDNVTMQIDTVLYFQITDPKLYAYGVERPMSAIENLSVTTMRNIIGDMDLEQTLTSRDTINSQMRALLDEATDPWGIKVNRVEVKNIQPPPDIQSAMEKQMKAEREKREAVLRAEGQRQSQILVAEGEKESMILRADAAKQAAIKKAEGEAEAILKVQQATAEAIKLLNEADPKEAVLRIKALEAFQAAADGKATKIIIPSEIQGLAGLCASAKAVFDSVEPNKPKPSAESK